MPSKSIENRPVVAGIVNITEDSFSDGGQFLAPDAALQRAQDVLQAGAGIIELGPASSHPDSNYVPAETQISRLTSVMSNWTRPEMLSVDCTLPAVQRWSMQQSVGFINDIRGFSEPEIYDDLAAHDCKLIVMHSITQSELATRVDVPPEDILERIWQFFDARLAKLEAAGIHRSRMILDPGMGFFLGTNPNTSLVTLQATGRLRAAFNLPVMISVSRKSFLQKLAGVDAAGAGSATLAAELYAAANGADIIRTHDVAAIHNALRIQAALTGS